jgi:Big-like domain-containing protein
MCSARRGAALAALLPWLVLAACSTGDVTRPPGGQASLIVHVNLDGTAVARIVVDVSAPDIAAPLVFNIPITAGVASGTITIPAGSDRTIAFQAFDAANVKTHSGSTTIAVQAGINPGITITLEPLPGDVPIDATLGSFSVAVTPTPNTLSVAGAPTVQLAAAVLDAQGQTVTAAAVSWATHDPGIASVSATGLVTAARVGQTDIFATFQGAAGSAAITVTP